MWSLNLRKNCDLNFDPHRYHIVTIGSTCLFTIDIIQNEGPLTKKTKNEPLMAGQPSFKGKSVKRVNRKPIYNNALFLGRGGYVEGGGSVD